MKKKWVALLLATVSCGFAFASFPACKEKDEFAKYKLSSSFDEMEADIADADSLAIVKRSDLTEGAGRKRTGTDSKKAKSIVAAADSGEEELVFAKVEEDGEVVEVAYKEEDGIDYTVSQGDFDAEIYKMKVVGDFTFVAYISSKIRENNTPYAISYKPQYGVAQEFTLYTYGYYLETRLFGGADTPFDSYQIDMADMILLDRTKGIPQNFDEVAYFSYGGMQSYVICNSTGKIYSMADFPGFDIVGDKIAVRGTNAKGTTSYTYYYYSVNEEGDLVIEDVLPNKDITVHQTHADPYGWKYVYNEGVSETSTEKKTIYYRNEYDYLFDREGYAYSTKKVGEFYTPAEKLVDGVKTDLGKGDIFGLWTMKKLNESQLIDKPWNVNKDSCYGTLAKIGDMAVLNSNDLHYLAYNLTNGKYIRHSLPSREGIFWLGDECKFWCAYDENKNLRYYEVDWSAPFGVTADDWANLAEWEDIQLSEEIPWSAPILENTTKESVYFFMSNGIITYLTNVYSIAGLNGTEYYTVGLNAEGTEVMATLISESFYESTYLVIQPLN